MSIISTFHDATERKILVRRAACYYAAFHGTTMKDAIDIVEMKLGQGDKLSVSTDALGCQEVRLVSKVQLERIAAARGF